MEDERMKKVAYVTGKNAELRMHPAIEASEDGEVEVKEASK